MRDPARIPRMLETIRKVWEAHPDLRLGQLLVNAMQPSRPSPQVFYFEDDQLEPRIAAYPSADLPAHDANEVVRRRRASVVAGPDKPEVSRPADDVYCWLEAESSVMLKAVTRFGDPVELSADEVRAIAAALLAFADRLEPLADKLAERPRRLGRFDLG